MRRRIIDDNKLRALLRQGKTLMEMGKELGVSHVAIHKRIKKIGLLELPESVKSLTEKERNFCLAVVSGQSRTNAVMQAYDVSSRESAKALQNTLMKNPEIKVAIDELMELKGIGREFRIEKLGEHMKSHDPVVSLKALDIGFELSGDEAESKKNNLEKPEIKTEIDPIYFKFKYSNLSATFEKAVDKCTLCEKKGGEIDGICLPCREKYPGIVDMLERYWTGDKCAICHDDSRCYDFCKACKERKEAINHV